MYNAVLFFAMWHMSKAVCQHCDHSLQCRTQSKLHGPLVCCLHFQPHIKICCCEDFFQGCLLITNDTTVHMVMVVPPSEC